MSDLPNDIVNISLELRKLNLKMQEILDSRGSTREDREQIKVLKVRHDHLLERLNILNNISLEKSN